jgi:hypothetical protein
MKMAVFWVIPPFSLVEVTRLNFNKTPRRYNPEDSHLRGLICFPVLRTIGRQIFTADCIV